MTNERVGLVKARTIQDILPGASTIKCCGSSGDGFVIGITSSQSGVSYDRYLGECIAVSSSSGQILGGITSTIAGEGASKESAAYAALRMMSAICHLNDSVRDFEQYLNEIETRVTLDIHKQTVGQTGAPLSQLKLNVPFAHARELRGYPSAALVLLAAKTIPRLNGTLV